METSLDVINPVYNSHRLHMLLRGFKLQSADVCLRTIVEEYR